MITEEQALALADAAAVADGWSRITAPRYEAVSAQRDGREVWEVQRRGLVIGQTLTFTIDAESGAVLRKHRQGLR